MISEIKSITGGLGTELITSSVTNKNYIFLVINTDVVLNTISGSQSTDILADLGLGTNTITQGMIIRPKNGESIKDVTLTSGSVFGIIAG